MFISVVAPCLNEEEVLFEFYRRMKNSITSLDYNQYEIIFIDDGSIDNTWEIIKSLHNLDRQVKGIKLSRNFGHQSALTAGLTEAKGEYIFIIDSDLQDPPELLIPMLELMQTGHDVVYGKRVSRQGETHFKRLSAKIFYRILSALSDISIPQDTGDFRLINKKVNDAYRALSESHRFTRGLITWLGFKQCALPYERLARFAGETKYPLKKMINFSLDAMTGFSLKPLRLITYLGIITSCCSLIALSYTLWGWLQSENVPGWTSLMVIILLLSSAQLISIGVIGEYVGRTFVETKRRPLYLIQERIDSSDSLSFTSCVTNSVSFNNFS
jgi:polyisoprenyl-phosphate glycosyltransferase